MPCISISAAESIAYYAERHKYIDRRMEGGDAAGQTDT